jgi:hypothetical protein
MTSTPTRRGLFSAFASLTPAAGAVDPIYAAIERHRAAWNAAEAAMNDVSRHHAERTAAEALAATVPASRAGVVALVGYLPRPGAQPPAELRHERRDARWLRGRGA